MLYFCPQWGSTHLRVDDFYRQVKDAVETTLNPDNLQENLECLEKYDLQLIAQYADNVGANFEKNQAYYQEQLHFLASINPLFINSQTGKDYYSFEQNQTLIELASKVTQETGVKVIHETHRGKFSFAAHIAKNYLEQIPDLEITADFSHWCNVAESLLEDQAEAVQLAIEKTVYIHGRVGFQQSAQIPDPRAEEWQEVFEEHLVWCMVESAQNRKLEQLTITPEFGPYPYMTILPLTRQPITNQWDVNLFIKDFLKNRYLFDNQ